MSERQPIQKIEVFVDQQTRINRVIQRSVQRELALLEQQGITDWGTGDSYLLTPIRFPSTEDRGEIALYYLNDCLDTEEPECDEEGFPIEDNTDPTTYFVRPTTLRVLDALQIPYQNLAEPEEK